MTLDLGTRRTRNERDAQRGAEKADPASLVRPSAASVQRTHEQRTKDAKRRKGKESNERTNEAAAKPLTKAKKGRNSTSKKATIPNHDLNFEDVGIESRLSAVDLSRFESDSSWLRRGNLAWHFASFASFISFGLLFARRL